MKHILSRFAVISVFSLLCVFTNLYGTIAFAQESNNLRQRIDSATPHISGNTSITIPEYDPSHIQSHDTDKLMHPTSKEEAFSKTQKNNAQSTQSVNSHLSGSTSKTVSDSK